MLKYLLIALLILWLLYSPGVRKLLRRGISGESTKPATKPQTSQARTTAVVPCAHCGVHLPQGEALFNDAGQPFCSEAHLRAQKRDR